MTEFAAALWGLAAFSLAWWLLRRAVQLQWKARVERVGIDTMPGVTTVANLGLRRSVRSWGSAVARRWPPAAVRASRLADAAGLAGGTTSDEMVGDLVGELMGWKLVGALLGTAVGMLALVGLFPVGLSVLGIPLAIVLAAVGWLSVDFWLARQAAARRRAIERSLVTIADLLTLCLEAGMGIDRALRLICTRMHSPLADELLQVLAEIELGASRRDAFAHLVERVPLDEIRALATAIIQAEELSASLAGAMRTQSQALRVSQRHLMEAEAQRAPVKMLVPMVLFVLPALFIVVLGPVVLQMVQAIGNS